jgi:hypothetical protein
METKGCSKVMDFGIACVSCAKTFVQDMQHSLRERDLFIVLYYTGAWQPSIGKRAGGCFHHPIRFILHRLLMVIHGDQTKVSYENVGRNPVHYRFGSCVLRRF